MNVTADILTARAKALGLPITKNAFEGTLENTVPDMPYLVWLQPHEMGRGADGRNNLKAQNWDLELYTPFDDEVRQQLAERIETQVLYDVEYECFVAYIEEEECYQTAYEVKGILKKNRKENIKHG